MQASLTRKTAPLALISVLAALAGFIALQIWAYIQAGVLEYPLDDPYIHLAMAAEMMRGGYGVNHGEFASASSSPLFPVLLMPFSGSEYHRYLPLFWNSVALIAAAYFWGKILRDAGYVGLLAIALAAFGPLALNMHGVAFSGMEHTIHVALSLAALSGMQRFIKEDKITWLLLAVLVLGPMIRFEGLAVTLAVSLVFAFRGRPWVGGLVFIAAALPVIGFGYWLTTLGLAPLPNSVMAKLGVMHSSDDGALVQIFYRYQINLQNPIARFLLMLALASLVGTLMMLGGILKAERKIGLYLSALLIVVVGHLSFGAMGWMFRYEHYVLVFAVACIMIALAPLLTNANTPQSRQRIWTMIALVILALPAAVYAPRVINDVSYSPSQIYRQQGQMARFVRDYLKAPVAVNDLGKVVFGNPHYVLDLYGLASKQALDNRLNGAPDGWADPLAKMHKVKLAMIYEKWMGDTLGPDWVFLGTLDLQEENLFIADSQVTFHAPNQMIADELLPMLRDFAKTLPKGVVFDFATGADQR